MSAGLLPCPMCGAAAHRVEVVDDLTAWIVCKNEDCCAEVSDCDMKGVERWNRRAPVQAQGVALSAEPEAYMIRFNRWTDAWMPYHFDTSWSDWEVASKARGEEILHNKAASPEHWRCWEAKALYTRSALAQAQQSEDARYRYLRTLNPRQFTALWESNIAGKGAFDDLVDLAIAALTGSGTK